MGGMTVSQLAYSVQQGIKKHQDEFQEIFKVPLRKFMWDGDIIPKITGFDIFAFDTWLECPEDTAVAEHIENKYGKRAVELVKELLEYPKTK